MGCGIKNVVFCVANNTYNQILHLISTLLMSRLRSNGSLSRAAIIT